MKKYLAITLLVLIPVLLYALTIRGVFGNPDARMIVEDNLTSEGGPFESGPELGRYVHVMSMVETGKYNFSKEIADIKSPDFGYYDGRFYSFFAPGVAFLALPFYIIGKYFGLAQVASYSLLGFASVLTLVFLYKIAREVFKLPLWLTLLTLFIFGFSSTAWTYATSFFQHPLTALFMMSGFYAVWRYKTDLRYNWIWAAYVWTMYALGIFIDYPNAVLLLPIMVYFVFSSVDIVRNSSEKQYNFHIKTSIFFTFIFFALITFFHLHHNYQHFGGWLRNSGGTMNYTIISNLGLLDRPDAEERIEELRQKKDVVGSIVEQKTPRGFVVLLFSTDRGLFLYMPIFIFALYGMYRSLKENGSIEHVFLISLVCLNIFFYSSWGDPWGGWAYGPRYLIPSMSILALYVGVALSYFKPRVIYKIIIMLFLLYSSAIALLGALTTDNIPPKVQAIYMTPPQKYNFLANVDYLKEGTTGSFMYNNFFKDSISLLQYFYIIYAFLIVLILLILFVIPRMEKRND